MARATAIAAFVALFVVGSGDAAYASVVALPPTTIVLPTSGSFLYLNSQPGDVVGAGVERLDTTANATFEASLPQGGTYFNARLQQGWFVHWATVMLAAPSPQPLVPGSYAGADGSTPGQPHLYVSVDGRGCNMPTGQFDVTEISYSSYGDLLIFDATFEQHCDGASAALFGRIRIDRPEPARGVTLPSGAVTVPTSGTFLYVFSEPGDPIGEGAEHLFALVDYTITGSFVLPGYFLGSSYQVSSPPVTQYGDYHWGVRINSPSPLTVGKYLDPSGLWAYGYPTVSVTGPLTSCPQYGKFDIDELSFWPGGELRTFQLTFEQRCGGTYPALFGRMRIENPSPEPPLEMTVRMDPRPHVDNKTGVVTVTGTVTCSRTAAIDVSGSVSQAFADHKYAVGGQFAKHVYCTAPGAAWSARVTPYGGEFIAGLATATFRADSYDARWWMATGAAELYLNAGNP